jgi:hypothetical protein
MLATRFAVTVARMPLWGHHKNLGRKDGRKKKRPPRADFAGNDRDFVPGEEK